MIHGVKPLPGWQALPPSPPRERRAAVSLSPPKPVKLSEATRKRLTELQRAVDINREEARIQRILDLKDRAFQAIWAIFAAAWIAIFGFLGRIAWAEWGGDIVGEVLASSSSGD